MPPQSIYLIVNPVAGRGRSMRVASRVRSAFAAIGDVIERTTTRPGEERTFAEAAATDGATAIVVVGGDGTLSHVARGIVASGRRIPLAIIAAGTGNDFAKSVGAPVYDIAATVKLVQSGVARRVDVGTVDHHVFVNAAGFGFDAEVLAHASTHGIGNNASAFRYASVALRHLFGYRGFVASMQPGTRDRRDARAIADANSDIGDESARWLTIVFANGSCFGGVFRIAPDARIDDGLIDCIAIRDASSLARAAMFAQAVRGAHVRSAAVRVARHRGYTLRFSAAPRFQVDGELVQASSSIVHVGVLPGALSVFAPL